MNNAGRNPTISDDDIIDLIRDHEDAVVSTMELAELMGMTREGALKRLHSLEDKGELEHQTIGDTYAWYIPRD
jgi:predicted transcriptional regulator